MPDVRTRPAFRGLFDAEPEVRADAPGRVNLIGEHTDYHGGYVLPAVIPQRARVEARTRADRRVRAWSAAVDEPVQEYAIGAETRGRGWLDYVQGVTTLLRQEGAPVSGVDLRIESDVPVGAGVSSSAALEVSVLRALRSLYAWSLDDVALAKLAQRVETEFVGVPVGIMDQMASSVGRDGEALFVDTASLAIERLPLPRDAALVVIDSGVVHQHAGGEYVTRRRESFEAATRLGVERLRDAGLERLPQLSTLPPLLARRARHVITENQRVLDAVTALRDGDVARLGALFNASHASMRDDYETSTPEIDTLVTIAQQHPSVYGARLTGGGFGGAVVMLAEAPNAARVARGVRDLYTQQTGRRAVVLVPPAI
jgi:galactokinase